MKRNTYHLSAALALLLGLAACTQDELSSPSGGVEGAAMTFTATGLNPAATAAAGTRAPVDGDWEGVQSVAVMIGGKVKAYDVTPTTADHTSATLTSTDPHYWADHNDLRVTAWWPYNGEENLPAVKVRADQSTQDGYEGSDFIAAEEQAVSYANPTLRFTHRTARVTVALTNRPEESMNVRLTGLSTENENPAVITPYNQGGDTWSALVAPQKVAQGTAFITCTFTSGKSFVYRMQKEAEWKAGEEYTYTVSLAAAEDPGYTVSEDGKTYNVTSAEGLKNIAELVNGGKTDINITLDKNIDLTGKEWTPIGNYEQQYTGTFDGGNHIITGLTVNQSGTDHVGLFGTVGKGGMVKDVRLENVNISVSDGGSYLGGIVGESGGTIENCSVSGSISGSDQIGGIAGGNIGTITACTATGSVSGGQMVGGIVGENSENGAIIACTATGSVLGKDHYAGGIAGYNDNSTVTACYHAKGNVSGASGVGGAVGENFDGTLTACYWSGLPDNDNGGATKVDGTTVTWQTAVDAMNNALQSAGSEWQYELTGELLH